MHFLAAIALALPLYTTASPLLDLVPQEQDAHAKKVDGRSINCNGTSSVPFDCSCHATLGISDWLSNWIRPHQRAAQTKMASHAAAQAVIRTRHC